MAEQTNKLFRQEALDRLSSPERLDQLIKVINPRDWLPLAILGVLTVAGGVWSVVGRIPLNVSGQGVLVVPRRVVQLQASTEGRILKLNVQPGDQVKQGDVIAIISQSTLEKQLQQEKDKLTELLEQNQKSATAQKQTAELELDNIQQQRGNLEESLRREAIVPELRQQNLKLLEQNRATLIDRRDSLKKTLPSLQAKTVKAIAENRKSLQERLNQIKAMLPSLKQRVESHRRLLEEGVIAQDVMLNAQQEYFNSVAQVSESEAQLKQLDVQEVESQRQYQQNLNEIDNLNVQLQQINAQKSELQHQYLQSLNQVDDLRAKLEALKSQEAKLKQQTLESSQDRTNRIQEVKRRIAQLEQDLVEKSKVISPYTGRLLEVAAVPGQLVNPSTRLSAIETDITNAEGNQLVSLAYFANKDGKKIEPGMKVQITPSIIKRERYGGIVGQVTSVSPFPVTQQNMATIIGNENLAESIVTNITHSGGDAPLQVIVKLEPNPRTISGYQWSSSEGPPIKLSSGTTAQVRVKIGEVAPVSYVVPILRSFTGVY